MVKRCSVSPTILSARISDDVKRLEETEDCFVLEFDPVKISVGDGKGKDDDEDDDDDVTIVAEKGQIASRDYPHARHLCPRYPFATTPHETHCKNCYCYVCDLAAPCDDWRGHCDATDQCDLIWKSLRDSKRCKTRCTNLVP